MKRTQKGKVPTKEAPKEAPKATKKESKATEDVSKKTQNALRAAHARAAIGKGTCIAY